MNSNKEQSENKKVFKYYFFENFKVLHVYRFVRDDIN